MADHTLATSFSHFTTLLLFSLFVLTGLSAGASVSFDQSVICVSPGTETPVSLILDAAPAGISGYTIMISMENPDIGEITEVTLPEWAEISDVSGVPGTAVRIKAVDLQGQVDKGATGIVLATISLHGISPGTTDIILSDPEFDNEDGNPMNPSIVNTTFTVSDTCTRVPETTSPETNVTTTTGSTLSPAGSGGGGSGSGSSSPATTIPAATIIPGMTGNEPSVTITSEQAGMQTHEGTLSATAPATPSTTLTETAPPVTRSQGMPFITAPGILVLIGAMVLLGQKKR